MPAAFNLPDVIRPGIPLGSATITIQPHPLRAEFLTRQVPAGLRLDQVLARECVRARLHPSLVKRQGHVWVDGRHVLAADVNSSLRPGQEVFLAIAPQNSGGGGKNPITAIASIALSMMAPAFGGIVATELGFAELFAPVFGASLGWDIAAAIAGGGLVMGGSWLLGSLGGASQPGYSPTTSGEKESPIYSLSGMRNSLQPWGKMPLALGFNRYSGPMGAAPYTEVAGDDQFERVLVDWGYGPLVVQDLQLADTPLEEYSGVETQTREGRPDDPDTTLYPDDVYEDTMSTVLSYGERVVRRSAPQADELSIDLGWEALVAYNRKGNRTDRVSEIKLEYRPVGSDTWLPWETVTKTARSSQAVRESRRIQVDRGQYDVGLTRLTEEVDSDKIYDEVKWTCLRTFTNRPPTNFPFAKSDTSLRIQASDQLSGIVDELNALTKSEVLDWDAETESWTQTTSNNPAALFRWVVQSDACPRPQPDSALDLDQLSRWHEFCKENNLTFNQVRDTGDRIWDLLFDICQAGKAWPEYWEGKLTVVMDEVKEGFDTTFSPDKCWGMRGKRRSEEPPHAFRCRYFSSETLQWDEIVVYADGYDRDTASLYEVLEVPGVDNPEQMYFIAKWKLAIRWRRAWYYELYTDWKWLDCRRGSRCRIQHWALAVGLGSGRVKTVTQKEDGTCTVQLDAAMTMKNGKDYCLELSGVDTGEIVRSVRNVPGTSRTLILEVDPGVADPRQGDVWMFGERDKTSRDCLLIGIEPASTMTCKLTFVDYAPEVLTAHEGELPDFESVITVPAFVGAKLPSKPIIEGVKSGETVMTRTPNGDLVANIVVQLQQKSGTVKASTIQAQYREQGGGWRILPNIDPGTNLTIPAVEEEQTYDIRVRAVAATSGKASEWTYATETVVGQTSLPPDVPQLMISGGKLSWSYPDEPPDFLGFRVRYAAGRETSWARTTSVHQAGHITVSEHDVSSYAGTKTSMVKAVDRGGRESENAAMVVINLGDPLEANVVERYALHPTFSGVIENGSVQSNKLVADGAPIWSGDDAALFWAAEDSQLLWSDTFAAMAYEFSFYPPKGSAGAMLTLPASVQGEGVRTRYATDSQRVLWTGEDSAVFLSGDDDAPFLEGKSEWRDWPGKLEDIEESPYYFRITAFGGSIQAEFSEIECVVDVEDQEELFDDLAISAQGSRPSLTLAWNKIKNVSLSLQDDGGDGFTTQYTDKDPVLGPMIVVKDQAGNLTSGVVDVRLQGY